MKDHLGEAATSIILYSQEDSTIIYTLLSGEPNDLIEALLDNMTSLAVANQVSWSTQLTWKLGALEGMRRYAASIEGEPNAEQNNYLSAYIALLITVDYGVLALDKFVQCGSLMELVKYYSSDLSD